jgi:S-adenosylmethionine decarboxylase
LIESYFSIEVVPSTLADYFRYITKNLSLKTYGEPVIHETSGAGKDTNQGYDGFVPLIDSGIYVAVWSRQQFLSAIIYTCKDFDEGKALSLTKSFFSVSQEEHKLF